MSESKLRKTILDLLKKFHAIPVENGIYPGTPDVSYANGWMELKVLPGWPKGCIDNPVRVSHFTPRQRMWLTKRWLLSPGSAWFLIKIGKTYLLFDGPTAASKVGNATSTELRATATAVWENKIDGNELCTYLNLKT